MNPGQMPNRHQLLVAQLNQLANHPDSVLAYREYQAWVKANRISDAEMVAARIDYLAALMVMAAKSNDVKGAKADLGRVSDRLQYTPQEHQQASFQYERLMGQSSPPRAVQKQPVVAPIQPVAAPKSNVLQMNPLDIGKMDLPSGDLADEIHVFGESLAAIAGRFKLPLEYDREKSRKSIRVQRLSFRPQMPKNVDEALTDVSKILKMKENFVCYGGLKNEATILIVNGGIEIHNPIPGDEWERPHFKAFIKQTVPNPGSQIPEGGVEYTPGVDLDGKALTKRGVEGIIISGRKRSGKTQHLLSFLTETSLRYNPKYVKLALFDVCGNSLMWFEKSPWLFQPVCLDVDTYEDYLLRVQEEAHRREDLFRKHKVSSIEQWNRKFPDNPLFRIVVVVEEFAETCARLGSEIANAILASLAQANGKHGIDIVLATQVVDPELFDSGLLKNLSDRVVFAAATAGASTQAFGYPESAGRTLLGKGDGFLRDGDTPIRLQSLYMGDDDGESLIQQINYWGEKLYGKPKFVVPVDPVSKSQWDEVENPDSSAPSEEEGADESLSDRERYDIYLKHLPKFSSGEISLTKILSLTFWDRYGATVTGGSKKWCEEEVLRLKEKFGGIN